MMEILRGNGILCVKFGQEGESVRAKTLPPLPLGEGWGEGFLRSESPSPNRKALTLTLSQGERGRCFTLTRVRKDLPEGEGL